MTPLMHSLVVCLRAGRFPLEDEKTTQSAIEQRLRSHGFGCCREQRIVGGIIDFLVDDSIGIEVKIKGQPAAIVRQIKGYTAEPSISGIILITSKPVPLCPTMIREKPIVVVDMARAWL